MRIRAYTLAVHAGHAPCWMYDPVQKSEVLSLANCKPPIRDAAPLGEWVAAITPTRMGLRFAYLMRVDERLTRHEYWLRYRTSRLDSIYKPKSDGGWIQLENPWHFDAESFGRDMKSDWVLLSRNFFMFANSYSEREKSPRGLSIPAEYSALARGGMRSYGQFIDVPDTFLSWIAEQPRLKLGDFRVLRPTHGDGCRGNQKKAARACGCG